MVYLFTRFSQGPNFLHLLVDGILLHCEYKIPKIQNNKENIMVTDQNFAALRDRIIHLEGQVAYLYKHLGITFVAESAPGDDPRVIEAIKGGNLMQAIKVYREVHSNSTITIGMDQAKAAVEEIKGRLGI
jgi:hypothetical protein